MHEVFWLEPDRLGGRAGPTREAWLPDNLRAAGIGAILNVSEHEEPTRSCSEFGIDVEWVPMPVTVPPEEGDVAACLEALPRAYAFVRAHLEAGRRVLVHCVRGRDRTGLVLAYHLACAEGLPGVEAISRVRSVRPEALTADGWEAMAVRVIDHLVGGQG